MDRLGVLVPPVAFCAVAVLSAGCVVHVDSLGFVQHEEKRFDVSGVPDLDLSTFDGSIEIRGGERSNVEVDIEKRAASKDLLATIDVVAEQEGNRIRVEVKRPQDGKWIGVMTGPSRTARLIVHLPAASNITARSGDGSISIERVEGRVDLHTQDGSIRGIDVKGDISVRSDDGSVRFETASGRINVETADGSVSLSGALRAVRAESGDGSITLRVDPGTAMDEDWNVLTRDGRIVLYLPRDFSASVDAETDDGRVRSDLSFSETGSDRSRRSLRGQLGSGGRTIRLRTGDGSISLRSS